MYTKMVSIPSLLLLVLALGVPLVTSAFQATSPKPQQQYTHHTALHMSSSPPSGPATPEEMFASAGWQPIKEELDTLPIFCCANKKGQPLQYNVNDETTMPFFYTDAKDAEAELTKAKAELSKEVADGLGIIPFPMGTAFELMAQNKAAIIPSVDALKAAGAPSNVEPLGQQVPLFCCMDIMQESPKSGKPVLPIFMVHAEAMAAMKEAVSRDGPTAGQAVVEDFEVVSLSLPRAVEILATNGQNAPKFHFLPPKESISYIQTYLEKE